MSKFVVAQFDYEKWHPLTDLPINKESPSAKTKDVVANENKPDNSVTVIKSSNSDIKHPFDSLSDAKTLLYHLIIKPGLSIREIMKELNFSGSAIEKAKHELVTRGLIIESRAGRKKRPIPKKEAFDYFGILCPYLDPDLTEHSFYAHVLGLTLKKNTSCKKVSLEYKLSNSGNASDVVTQDINGNLYAFEITDSISNIAQNCLKYDNTAFTKITFVCRNDDILKAVKSKVINAGLPLQLLGKLDFVLLDSILKATKK
ncbi:MAG: hypothetical protein A2Y10_14790 [Planctomycetes bacterium GWF2_41_51]|nr:MAG: hypothetical protein A2Y10_14790 [Planctomycetes bacterium GWF2_41_51]HBG28990.1 hypothetical protein [Phycisphaerales bacterium]